MNELFRRKYLISMFYLMVVVIGVMVWQRIPVEMSPEMQLPSITVDYHWSRTSPEVMEQEITRRVERQVRPLRDVERITSVTREGHAGVTIYFHQHAPVDYRAVELQEHLRVLESGLPPSIRPAQISRRVPSELQDMQTFLVYSISGEREPFELLEYTERNIKLPLSGIPGIAGIELTGVRDPALTIDFDVAAAERLGISVPVVMQQISSRLHIMAMTYFDNRDNIDPYVGGLGYRFSRYVRFGEAWGGRPEYDYITVTVRPPVGSPFEEIDKIIRQYLYFG